MIKIFVPKETAPEENRVAITPETVKKYIKAGCEVMVEAGAGGRSYISDDDYKGEGAAIIDKVADGLQQADIVLKVAPPSTEEISQMKEGGIIIGFMYPHRNDQMIESMVSRKVTALSVELIPRITRAQSMDALSSQANIAGYKAVLIAAARLEKYFPQLMTAAGTVKPARVVIIGAGVAGLQAIATARRLGAIVEVSDIRPEVEEQVKSLGGKFIPLPEMETAESEGGYAKEVTKEFLDKQQEILARHVAAADVVITTALVPGRPAPKLVTEEMVKSMATGTVIVDLAVEEGGNCVLSESGKEVNKYGVAILGDAHLPGSVAKDASSLYARNLKALLDLLIIKGELKVDLYEEIIHKSLIAHNGEKLYPPKEFKHKEEEAS